VDASTTPAAAAAALQAAGDQMLRAVIFHSDNLELSEQFDATTGYEKSVSNLSWSYASFLSAERCSAHYTEHCSDLRCGRERKERGARQHWAGSANVSAETC
jgi:hypothetical protein